MAQVAQDTELRKRIDGALAYLLKEWTAVPEIVDEWDDWDKESRLAFALEWSIREDWLQQVSAWAEQGLFTPDQQAHFHQVQRLVQQNRTAIERLLVG